MEEIQLWAFWYNPMIHESASYIVSYHKTKKGALSAMKSHKEDARKEWEESENFLKKWCEKEGIKYRPIIKFGVHESWEVEKFTLVIED